eukprot:gene15196-biopygen11782
MALGLSATTGTARESPESMPGKSGKVRESPGKSGEVRKSPEESGRSPEWDRRWIPNDACSKKAVKTQWKARNDSGRGYKARPLETAMERQRQSLESAGMRSLAAFHNGVSSRSGADVCPRAAARAVRAAARARRTAPFRRPFWEGTVQEVREDEWKSDA